MRWMMVTLLLLCATPAMAQLANDPANAEPVNPDPPQTARHVIPPSVVNADRAVVVASSAKSKATKTRCSDTNPCATPTPESR